MHDQFEIDFNETDTRGELITDFKDKVCCCYISKRQTLSDNFILEFCDQVDSSIIIKHVTINNVYG